MSHISNLKRVAAPVVLLATAACDLSVTNPGPVQDSFLDDEGAHPAVVAGIELNLSLGLNMIGFFGSEAAKEYTQGGRIHPTKLPPNPGQLDNTQQLPNNAWNSSHQARWIAEDGVRRLEDERDDFSNSPLAAQALVYAGFANRILGENMCDAVVNSGPVEPRTVNLTRAEEHFTRAIAVATAAGRADLAQAAYGGRAAVRLWLGNNAGAVSDADQVDLGYEFRARYASNPTGQNNFIMYISSNTPYRAHTVWNTVFETYYTETGDPRTAWEANPAIPNTEVGQLPWFKQRKYGSLDSPINLTSGREMVLIKAEVALRAGEWQNAITLINSLRQGLVSDHDGSPIPLATAANLTEAWTALKRERAVELWLESRRLGDLWRWVDAGTPGEMEDVSDRIRLCFPVATSELQTNPNIPLDYESPHNPLYTG